MNHTPLDVATRRQLEAEDWTFYPVREPEHYKGAKLAWCWIGVWVFSIVSMGALVKWVLIPVLNKAVEVLYHILH